MKEFILRKVKVHKVAFGKYTEVKNGCLTIEAATLTEVLLEDRQMKSVDIRIAAPGDSVRIVPVKDVIEPRARLSEEESPFPGIFSDPHVAGEGITVSLDGVCVVTTGKMVNFQEGVIDMSGPGAEFSTFSRKNNVVLVIEPVAGLSKHEHERVVRMAGLRAAAFLGRAGIPSEWEKELRIPGADLPDLYSMDPSLPRVLYVCQVIAQGLLHDNYIYGLNAQGCLPLLMTPGEVLDGAAAL
ncbi:MAG TPA: glycine/sarcosine/betaine reductase component B subunit, partial [Synergistales bacterium]|nr:glycine/sarcosine/betaine reductase component B subunit [Synergistales bacterium]